MRQNDLEKAKKDLENSIENLNDLISNASNLYAAKNWDRDKEIVLREINNTNRLLLEVIGFIEGERNKEIFKQEYLPTITIEGNRDKPDFWVMAEEFGRRQAELEMKLRQRNSGILDD